ncbi:unnamed protein product [Phytomonas sp. Hart1]|nr:unnamed protein product [Phytomonas sp. Hart1]|eukprot:CCW65962.1 unnamed protein product [Phytomonas sp. isolate Hart1]
MSRASHEATLAAAHALKNHCHHVINTMSSTTVPEAFLFRGNAYYALGQPYFALADYNIAESVLNLSSDYQARCLQAVQHFPEVQVGTYSSTNSHLHIFVKPYLSEKCDTAYINSHVGRGILANEALARHSVVMKASEPWLRYPTQDGLCAFCAMPLPERLFPCKNPQCHEEYCSRDCRALANSLYHSHVCTNEDFQSLELDLFNQMQKAQSKGGTSTDHNAAAAQLLMLRVLAVAARRHIVPSVQPEVRILSGRLTFSPKTLCESMLHIYERLVRAMHIATIISYEEMIGTLARITANCFHTPNAVELHLPRSMFNHSCEANVAEDALTGNIVTLREVAAGEELCINYYPHLKKLPYNKRFVELQRRGFDCKCVRCQQNR